MKIFLTVLFTFTLFNFLMFASNEEEFPEVRTQYIFASCFISALLFLIYKLY